MRRLSLDLERVHSQEGVFYEAMSQMEEESGKLADETMHLQFSTVGGPSPITQQYRCALHVWPGRTASARCMRDMTGVVQAWVGIEMEVKRGKKRKAADKKGDGGLKAVLQTGYELLVAGLQAKGLEGVAERVPFATFDRYTQHTF